MSQPKLGQPRGLPSVATEASRATQVVSGAGHDAVYVARVAPAAMIFVPCKDGISHNEIEDARPEHLTAGCNVLLHAMLERAGVHAASPDVSHGAASRAAEAGA